MVVGFKSLSSIMEGMYDLAVDESCWPDILAENAAFLDGHAAAMFFPTIGSPTETPRYSRRLAAEAQRQGCLDALAALPQGILLVGRGGEIIWVNPIAEALLCARDGLSARRRQLVAGDARQTTELTRLIASAVRAASDPLARPRGVMAIVRPSMKRPYQVLVAPLPRAAKLAEFMPDVTKVPVVAVFITDPEARVAPSADDLAKLHGFTSAEARLAAALAAGRSLKGYAEEARLSVNYVRWLLKNAEAKTDTCSQAELVRLLTCHIASPATRA
jgi:DNA-binding CsgD family transcriptional regulator